MIDSARSVIADAGVDGFTVDEVAIRSGVAKTTIYRHFGTGDALLVAALNASVEAIDTPDTGSLRGDLRAAVEGFLRVIEPIKTRRLAASLINRAYHDPDFAPAHQEMCEQRQAPLRRVVQRGLVRGEVDPELDIEIAMLLIEGPFVARRLVENEHLTRREVDALIEVIARALAKPAA
jgi:AcrR family transcriptional regulator